MPAAMAAPVTSCTRLHCCFCGCACAGWCGEAMVRWRPGQRSEQASVRSRSHCLNRSLVPSFSGCLARRIESCLLLPVRLPTCPVSHRESLPPFRFAPLDRLLRWPQHMQRATGLCSPHAAIGLWNLFSARLGPSPSQGRLLRLWLRCCRHSINLHSPPGPCAGSDWSGVFGRPQQTWAPIEPPSCRMGPRQHEADRRRALQERERAG